MKEISEDLIRQEVARLGAIVVETAVYHESGMKLFSPGDVITLGHAKALHASGIMNLFLLEFDEDARKIRKALGVERVAPKEVEIGDVLMEDFRGTGGELIYALGTAITSDIVERIRAAAFPEVTIRDRRLAESMRRAEEYFAILVTPESPGA